MPSKQTRLAQAMGKRWSFTRAFRRWERAYRRGRRVTLGGD